MPLWKAFLNIQRPLSKWQLLCVSLWTCLKLSKWSGFILMEQSILNYREERYLIKFNSNSNSFQAHDAGSYLLSVLSSSICWISWPYPKVIPILIFSDTHLSIWHTLLFISYWLPRACPAVAISKFIFINSDSHSPRLAGNFSSIAIKKRGRHQMKAPFVPLLFLKFSLNKYFNPSLNTFLLLLAWVFPVVDLVSLPTLTPPVSKF